MAKIDLIKGDITKIKVDVIVNAANSSLLGGGGVDGAIHRAGGPAILEECQQIRAKQGGCKTGEAVMTTAGNLPAQKVIHTVGPVWNGGENGEYQLLYNCYWEALQLAKKHAYQSIAFPNISTGIYRYPKELASEMAIDSVTEFIISEEGENEVIKDIIFVCFDDENYQIYLEVLRNSGLRKRDFI